MSFVAANLSPLSTANGFTLWHYLTSDTLADTQVPGYFLPAQNLLQVGHIITVQANNGTAMLPVLAGTLTGTATVLDTSGTPPTVQRSANLPFRQTLTANAEARAITFDPMPNAIEPGASIPAAVTILGSIANITFQLRNAAGTVIATQSANVATGRASTLFPAQASGGGYSILARNTADTAHFSVSPPFAIGTAPRLLTEDQGVLLLEQGGQLLLF